MIAIHCSDWSFSSRWIDYCKKNQIPYKIVNCFDNDIIQQLKGCKALMWHHSHAIYEDIIVAKKLLFALEHAKIKVFPDFNTSWHFDDKISQKYLLEAINAPLVPSYVFYSKKDAIKWIKKANFPLVFKLRGGAGSENVRLVKTKKKALKLVNISFSKGMLLFDKVNNFWERLRKYKNNKDSFFGVMKSFALLFIPNRFIKNTRRESGYIYFQEFIPNNDSDIRIIVIGDKAFGIRRLVREGDFRASGSGNLIYDLSDINIDCVKIAFDISILLSVQCICYDFVFLGNQPLIVEISYGFTAEAYDLCTGYWDSTLQWHNGKFNPQDWMVDNLIKSLTDYCQSTDKNFGFIQK